MDRRELRESRIRLERYLEPLLPLFGRKGRDRWGELYLTGLLLDGDRKSAGAMAERLDVDEQGLQQFVSQSTWDWWAIRRELALQARGYAAARSAFIIDDTGFPKKGIHSPGVARQYSGTLGKVGNCQVATSLTFATDDFAVPIDFDLYLPKEWADDHERRARAKIPEAVAFKEKWRLALGQLDRARSAGLQAAVVTADAGYGVIPEFREGLRERELRYVLGVTSDTGVWTSLVEPSPLTPTKRPGRPQKRIHAVPQPISVAALARSMPVDSWQHVKWREGKKRQLQSRFIALRVQTSVGRRQGRILEPMLQWLLVEWPYDEPQPTKYWLSDLPDTTLLRDLVYWAKIRWWIEQNYQQLKEELGLDHFEGRSWAGWHRHVTLTMMAFHFLTIEGLREKKTFWVDPPALSSRDPDHARLSTYLLSDMQTAGSVEPAGAYLTE